MLNEYNETVTNIINRYNDAYSKALAAYKRGDVKNYNLKVKEMQALEGIMTELNTAMAAI